GGGGGEGRDVREGDQAGGARAGGGGPRAPLGQGGRPPAHPPAHPRVRYARMTAAPGPEASGVVAWSDTSLRDLGAGPWGSVAGTEDIAGVAAALAASGAAVLEALDPESAHEALEVRGESPWDRLRAVVRNAGRTPVGVAISGRTLLGGRPVAPDLVRRFVHCAAESGAARVRAFDALNDADGLAAAAEAAAAAGVAFVPT